VAKPTGPSEPRKRWYEQVTAEDDILNEDGPVDPELEPNPYTASWQKVREEWISPRPKSTNGRYQGGSGSSDGRDKIVERIGKVLEILEDVTGQREEGELREAQRVVDGIIATFAQGKALKNPLPLGLVVKMLYGSWHRDGTIPEDYKPPTEIDNGYIESLLDLGLREGRTRQTDTKVAPVWMR